MKKMLILTGLAVGVFLLNNNVGDEIVSITVGMCWLIAAIMFYKRIMALIIGFIRLVLNVFSRIWDYFLYWH